MTTDPLLFVPLAYPDPTEPDPRGPGGLLALVDGQPQPLPLQEVSVRTSIAGVVARTIITQTFANALEHPVEAVHLFPLPERGAVTAMELIAGSVVVRAECRERVEAEQVYAEASASGHQAALLTAERDDVHTLRVARLPAGELVQVRIVVVEQLDVIDGRIRWRFPTVIAPRFMPGTPIGHDGPGIAADTDLVPDASRIQPPLRLSGGTSLDLQVSIAGPVGSLACTLHAVQMRFDDGDVVVAPRADSICDRDFILTIGSGAPDAVACRAWTDGTTTLAMVTPPMARHAPALGRDAIFVVDISGSMRGRKMQAAKRALKTALHGLLPGDRFRLIAFDDRLSPASPDLVPYTQAEVERADRWIDALEDRGGTVMLAPIQEALTGGSPTPADRLRTVLFITDGQAGDEDRLVRAVARQAGRARFFSLGIDTAVNGALLERLARVGGGHCELLTPMDDIEACVAGLEARFGSPILDGIEVDGGESADPRPAAVFAGRPAAMLIRGTGDRVVLRGRGPDGPWSAEVVPRRVEAPLGALWARRRIASLEDELVIDGGGADRLRAAIVDLAVEHQLASRFTAFVAVSRERVIEGEPVEVVQPVSLPHAWESADLAAPSMPVSAPSAAPPAPSPRRARAVPQKAKKMESTRAPAPASKGGLFGKLARGLGFGAAPEAPAAEAFLDDEDDGTYSFYAVPESLAERAEPADPDPDPDPDTGAWLAQRQAFDGGFGSVDRTLAALLTLILLGHTRRTGVRQRTVLKAATWLQANGASHPLASAVLDALARAEAGETVLYDSAWDALRGACEEGAALDIIAETDSPRRRRGT